MWNVGAWRRGRGRAGGGEASKFGASRVEPSLGALLILVGSLLACKSEKIPTPAATGLSAPQSAGGGSELLATGGEPRGIAVSAGVLYWGDASNGTIYSQPAAGGALSVVASVPGTAPRVLIVSKQQLTWWAENTSKAADQAGLWQLSLGGGEPRHLTHGGGRCLAGPVDGRVYWASKYDGEPVSDRDDDAFVAAKTRIELRSVMQDGADLRDGAGYFRCLTGDEREVFYCGRDQGSQSYGLLTGRVANNVYRQTSGPQPELRANADCDAMGLDDADVACLESSKLSLIPRPGGAARVLWKSNPPDSERLPGELSVALSAQYVYFASTDSRGGLYRVARAGGQRQRVAAGSVEQIAVDETYVYWVRRSGGVLRRRH